MTGGPYSSPTALSGSGYVHGDVHSHTHFGDGDDGYDAGTDSTISSCGEAHDSSDIAHLPEAEQAQVLFSNQKHHKGRWRQYARKPVRRVRRFSRKFMEKRGKGRAKQMLARAISAYVTGLSDDER